MLKENIVINYGKYKLFMRFQSLYFDGFKICKGLKFVLKEVELKMELGDKENIIVLWGSVQEFLFCFCKEQMQKILKF